MWTAKNVFSRTDDTEWQEHDATVWHVQRHINNNGCYCWSLALPLSLSLYGVCLRYLPTSFHVHQLLICVLSSLVGLVWSLTRAPRWIPPHLPHPSNPQLTLQEWCPSPPFALLLDAVLIMVPVLLYLQVGVHSQNRNPKQTKKKNLWKTKEIIILSRKSTLNVFFIALLAFLSRRKKGRKILIMANCCSILQVSVHSRKRW
jgi:hypothetical protein